MTASVSTAALLLSDFTAYDLPTKRWMKLIRPRLRLRVRAEHCDFVSSDIIVDDRSLDGMNITNVHWSWSDDPRPFFADDEEFEVEVERRFLLWYKCIRRTKRMSIDQIRTGNDCALPLYDGQVPAEMLIFEDRIEMGEITFTLRNDASSESAASQKGTVNASTYSE